MDRIFRKELRNYSQSAPDGVWENIELNLDLKEKGSVKFINFYKIAAAIAAFAIIGSSFLYFSDILKQDKNKDLIAQTDKIEKITESNKESLSKKIDVVEIEPDQNSKIEKENIIINRIDDEEKEDKLALPEENIVENDRDEKLEKLESLPVNIDTQNAKLAFVDVREEPTKSFPNYIPDYYTTLAVADIKKPEKSNKKKWSVGGEFTPLYSYRYITRSNSNFDKEYYNSVESPVMSYSGGVNVQYKTIGRLTVQTGAHYSSIGQSLDYMAVYANNAYSLVAEEYKDRYMNSYLVENSTGEIAFNSEFVFVDETYGRVSNLSDDKAAFDLSDPVFNKLDAEIQQSFKYIEVPLILRYKLIDKQIDLNFVGGIGANFLIGNDVYLLYGNNKEIIGETKNVNAVNYSSTLGFGIEYPIMNRINVRLEPSVKYYLNAINSESVVESHPYSFGVYTGINYSF